MSQESPSNQKPLYAEIRYDHDKTEDIVLISYLTVKEDGVYERFKPKNNNDYSKKAKYKCQYLECTDNEECNSNMCDHEIQNLRIRILRLGASEEDIKNRQETETTRNPGPPKRFQSDSSSDNDLKNKAAAKDNFVPAKKAQKSHNKGIGMSVLESLNNKQAPKMISQEILSQPRISVIDYKVKEDELRVREESIRRQENDIAKRIEDIREKENELVIRERIIENRMRGAGNRAEQVYEEETEEEEDNNNNYILLKPPEFVQASLDYYDKAQEYSNAWNEKKKRFLPDEKFPDRFYLAPNLTMAPIDYGILLDRTNAADMVNDLIPVIWPRDGLATRCLDLSKVKNIMVPDRSPVKVIEQDKFRLMISLVYDLLKRKRKGPEELARAVRVIFNTTKYKMRNLRSKRCANKQPLKKHVRALFKGNEH